MSVTKPTVIWAILFLLFLALLLFFSPLTPMFTGNTLNINGSITQGDGGTIFVGDTIVNISNSTLTFSEAMKSLSSVEWLCLSIEAVGELVSLIGMICSIIKARRKTDVLSKNQMEKKGCMDDFAAGVSYSWNCNSKHD